MLFYRCNDLINTYSEYNSQLKMDRIPERIEKLEALEQKINDLKKEIDSILKTDYHITK